jgi:multidrug efflux pump subunit AcrA (membrane-fusion protein)
VARISPQRIEGDRPLYPIYIEVDASQLPEGLAPGMSADASVIIAKVADALRLPRAVVKAGSGGAAQVGVWANGQREARMVKVGLRGDTYVEILDGLREGEEVVGE